MKEKKISQYQLIKTYGISTGQLDRLRKNENVNTYTLDRLCGILNCELGDIAQYRPHAQPTECRSERPKEKKHPQNEI